MRAGPRVGWMDPPSSLVNALSRDNHNARELLRALVAVTRQLEARVAELENQLATLQAEINARPRGSDS